MRAMRETSIADHSVVGDLKTVALSGLDGAIDFMCWPNFDCPIVFAAILDAGVCVFVLLHDLL